MPAGDPAGYLPNVIASRRYKGRKRRGVGKAMTPKVTPMPRRGGGDKTPPNSFGFRKPNPKQAPDQTRDGVMGPPKPNRGASRPRRSTAPGKRRYFTARRRRRV